MVNRWAITYLQLGVITHLLTFDSNFLGHPSKDATMDL